MKIKLTAVLLCVALLLTLSFNVSANTLTDTSQSVTDTQTTPVTDEFTVSVGENGEVSVGNLAESGDVSRAQTSGIVNGGIYRIKNVASGKYMNVDYGIDANGTNIYQWTGDGSVEQKFRVVYSSSTDSYMFYAMCSSNGTNRVLDVTRGSNPLISGQNIKLYDPTDPTSQEIKIVSLGSNKYKLAMRANESMAITAYGTSNGTAGGTGSTSAGNIFISTYTGSTNQQWQFELLENPNVSPTPIGYLDSVSTTAINGWAYQSNIPNTPLYVHIYITNNSTGAQTVYQTLANLYRGDLAAAGYGDGYHGFSYGISWMTFTPGTYTVKAYAIGVNSAINPQLTTTRSYTVRSPQYNVEYITSSYVEGWIWKPDAPNEPLAVHIYIYRSNGALYATYTAMANHYREDLEDAGYGNGYHGFSIPIDFASMPEERFTIDFHYVDDSGYHPAFYTGYYDNRMPIYLIGMTDENGVDFSSWATQEVVNYAYNIGTPSVMICSGATKEGLLNVIRNSSFAVLSSHGTATSIDYCFNPNTALEERGKLFWSDFLTIPSNYFINTRCLLLSACSVGNETENPAGNNMVKVFQSKGVQTVVGFVNNVRFRENNGVVDNNWGSERWAKVFVCELGKGQTVKNAKDTAVSDAIDSFRDLEELDYDKQYNDALMEARDWGLVDISIQGNQNQIVKH